MTTGRLVGADKIGLKVGKLIDKDKMAKHFSRHHRRHWVDGPVLWCRALEPFLTGQMGAGRMQTESRHGSGSVAPAAGESQAQRAYRVIEQMIVSLEIAPGARISELTLSTSLGIGRTPVREALQRLAREGTVQILPRSGAVVLDIDVDDHFKLIEVRREVERILIGRSARLADTGVRMLFCDLRDRFDQAAAAEDESLFIAADREFNALVAASADNRYAATALGPLQAQTRRFWFLYFQQFGDLATVCRLHAGICEAIAANDEAAARAASDLLIDYVEEYTYATMRALHAGA